VDASLKRTLEEEVVRLYDTSNKSKTQTQPREERRLPPLSQTQDIPEFPSSR